MTDIQERICDDMSTARRRQAIDILMSQLTTEDIEMIGKHFPHLIESALHEMLNPMCGCGSQDNNVHSIDGTPRCGACATKIIDHGGL